MNTKISIHQPKPQKLIIFISLIIIALPFFVDLFFREEQYGVISKGMIDLTERFQGFFEETTRVDAAKAWYIKMIEEGNYSEIEKTMEHWYENNCKELKTKYGLSVKYVL